ncbi:2-succinyl-6-hydroxy-2,4-cyclohexadiene-1-carboxylate synthase [Raoultibacter phocaeensis]|uniref:2-succinyl-6-hydroxy-2, 4-cyclohexadiene-1-carboxylate synthase n=1 Tax=Raoultibacter phocaeensis TaxID=2479841 RepID=UPI001118BA7A|nr:2-succinyl-6-hydroxy-2,4-cyclohexadiene-1-carboxylate synthase [Raoultibacter phocaeensis]
MVDVRETYFVYGGIRYHVVEWGDPDALPVVLLHGFAQSVATWSVVAPLLAAKRRVIALDFVGHGKSDKPDDPTVYEMDAVLDALFAFLRDRFKRKVALVGYSMGGRIALSFACRYPTKVSMLVLESAGLGPKTAQQHAAMQHRDAEMIERLLACDIASFMDWWEGFSLFESQKHLPETVRERVRAERVANDSKALALTVRGTGQHAMVDFSEKIGRLPMPILYIAGILDRKYLKIAENLAHGENVSCVLLNAGHNTHLEDPETFAAQVSMFLDKQAKRAGR